MPDHQPSPDLTTSTSMPSPGRAGPAGALLTWRERIELLAGGQAPAGRWFGGAVAVAVVAIGAVLLMRDPAPPPEVSLPVVGGPGDPATTSTTRASEVTVHAAGAVRTPGVFRLPAGSRVADLLTAAGGPRPEADPDRLNLAAPLSDGQRVYVPVEGEPLPPEEVASGGTGAGGLLDLNTATSAQLEDLPGIGPATAAAILEERDRRGRFGSVEDLLDVSGIGPAKLERIRELVTV